ncbi:MAG: fumarylacetoacetate hydrolase family protein [Pseudomonadota bacterium]|nr:fumarylacetoacetate hydrolase family protein [Pseudomonadota bacterium]
MKLATYEFGETARVGVVDTQKGRLLDLAAAAERVGWDPTPFASMLSLIDADDMGLELAQELAEGAGPWAALESVKLLSPLPRPRQMRDAMSFETHIRQSGRGARALEARAKGGEAAFAAAMAAPTDPLAEVYRQMPIYYITNRLIVAGPEATVRWPRYSCEMDYELEIAAVTRRTRANIPAAEAGEHIFGYTIFNDFSARDRQRAEMAGRLGPAKGKSFDGANVLGPWIVTADELGDPQTLNVEVRVNGETRAKGVTANMLFTFPQILAYASQDETIHAGEVFGSGTVGNCCGLEIGRFLEHGDVIELHVDRIGVLRNRVVAQTD